MHIVVCSYIKEKEKVKENQRTETKQKPRLWCTGKQKRGDIQNDVSLSEFATFLQVHNLQEAERTGNEKKYSQTKQVNSP